MDAGTTWAIIVALATALSTLAAASFKYLLGEIKELKQALVAANTSSAATNSANATLAAMVPGLMADLDKLRARFAERPPP